MVSTLVVTVVLAGAFNLAVDPLGVVGAPRIAGFNAIKPHLDHYRELVRWRAALRHCPSAVIFGNSRAEIGLDPENSIFARQGLNAVNQAIPGTDATTTLRQLHWLQSAGCMPRTIVLGVDFFDFLGGTAAAGPPPDAADDPPPQFDARWLGDAVFSLAALGDSLLTLAAQRARYPATLTDRGFNPLLNYAGEVERNGHYPLFRQRALENARSWTRKPPRLHPPGGASSSDDLAVTAILAQATAAGSTVHMVIYPYHAEIRMMLERLGLGELFGQWKKELVATAAQQAGRGGRVEVWDFSGISAQTLEPIPPRQDRGTRMEYYWEAGHFKKALGDQIIARVLGAPSTFGIRLQPDNVDAWVAHDRAAVQDLLAKPSRLREEVDDVVSRAQARAG
jgi:hypothetical protein